MEPGGGRAPVGGAPLGPGLKDGDAIGFNTKGLPPPGRGAKCIGCLGGDAIGLCSTEPEIRRGS